MSSYTKESEPLLLDGQQEKTHKTLFSDTREQILNEERILNFRNIFLRNNHELLLGVIYHSKTIEHKWWKIIKSKLFCKWKKEKYINRTSQNKIDNEIF